MIARPLLDHYIADGVPLPLDSESFRAYLGRVGALDVGFEYSQLVSRSEGDKREPPRSTSRGRAYDRHGRRLGAWPRTAAVTVLAGVLRERAIAEGIATKVGVAATYRPTGGAANSAHKEGAGIDLNGPDSREWYTLAVRVWCELGERIEEPGAPGRLPMGLGLYTWSGRSLFPVRSGYRVHLDAFAVAGTRSWQGVPGGFARPHKIPGQRARFGLPVLLAHELGLDVPSLRDL